MGRPEFIWFSRHKFNMELWSGKSLSFFLFIIIYNTVLYWCHLITKPPLSHLLTPSHWTTGDNKKDKKWEKLVDQHKDSLTNKSKVPSKAKWRIHSLCSVGMEMSSQFMGTKISSHVVASWEDNITKSYHPLPLFPELLLLSTS